MLLLHVVVQWNVHAANRLRRYCDSFHRKPLNVIPINTTASKHTHNPEVFAH